MPNLRWKKPNGAVIPRKTNIHVGSEVRLEGRFYDEWKIPEDFEVDIIRHFRGIGRMWRKKRRLPLTENLVSLGLEERPSATSFLSERFIVPNTGLRIHMSLSATDDLGNESPEVYATGLGGLKISPNITVAGTGGGLGEAQFTASVDPDVSFSILLPWIAPNDEVSLIGLVGDLAEDTSAGTRWSAEAARDEMLQLIHWALPTDPIEGWEVNIPDASRWIDENQTATVQLMLTTPTPGSCAFAVSASTKGDEIPAVSQIAILEVEEDLIPSLTLL